MVSCDWSLDRTDGVTLVRVRVDNDGPARRVRLENRLGGSVWPPRRQGKPAAGWADGTFEGVVPADGSLALGYASPAKPTDPPVELVSAEPAPDAPDESTAADLDDEDGRAVATDVQETPAGVVRSLGDPVVPRAAVPVPDDHGRAETESPPAGTEALAAADTVSGDRRPSVQPGRPSGGRSSGGDRDGDTDRTTGTIDGDTERYEGVSDSDGLSDLFSRLASLERRLAALEETEG